MLICGFLVCHNVPFIHMDHLTDILRKSFPDSKIAKGLRLKRTKATSVVRNVIGKFHKDKLSAELKCRKFSILSDDSTDIAAVKTTCVVVRFYDRKSGRIISQFWDLAQIFGGEKPSAAYMEVNATAEHLFNKIMETFDKYNIPRENIIGFGSDGCNTMMGANNSVASRFRLLCPGIIIIKCICHSLHICASEACKMLPRVCEDLARNIYNYFKSSSKRQCKFTQIQVLLDLDVHKILHPSQTRWLSLVAVVDRILEQWDALKLFFDFEYVNERLMAVEEIHKRLNNPFVKGYYLFLEWALPKFTNLNKYFQSESVIITNMHTKMSLAYRELLCSYLNRRYVNERNLKDVNPGAEAEFVPISNLYLGIAAKNQMELEEVQRFPDLVLDFKKRCRDFLMTGCLQLKKRYDFGDTVLSSISVLAPEKALSSSERDTTPSLFPLTAKLPRVSPSSDTELQKLDDEWRQMPFIQFPEEITKETQVDVFWDKVSKYTDSTGEPYLNVLPLFALEALSIPHSNAQCERIFSKVNLIKTNTRNRLVTPTIVGSILSSEYIKGVQVDRCCPTFETTNEMIRRMTAMNLYSSSKNQPARANTEILPHDDNFEFNDV